MLNQIVLVGRLVYDLQVNKSEKGKKYILFGWSKATTGRNLQNKWI